MGTYTGVSVAGFEFHSTKSAVSPEVMTVFRERDKRIQESRLDDGKDGYSGEAEIDRVITYSCLAWEAAARLDTMGFTLARVEAEFDDLAAELRQTFGAWAADEDSDGSWGRWEDFYSRLSFADYARVLRSIVGGGARSEWEWLGHFDPSGEYSDAELRRYVLASHDEYFMGFPCADPRSLLRLACEVSARDAPVVQDVTGLCEGGYYATGDAICQDAVASLTAQIPENAPVIVLTEGSSDRSALIAALELLHPHLVGYYAFLDFGAFRTRGGASHLVSLVKALAGAGVANRIVAIFDNDTAAADARLELRHVDLPSNIRTVSYPAIDLLRDYPTLGPSGLKTLDVNGLAGSIELYLGRDVLEDESGLTPVQWGGFVGRLGQYQGAVLHKRRLQQAFREKVSCCREDPRRHAEADWVGMQAVLRVLLRAFE